MTTTNRVHPVEEVSLDGLTPHPENYKHHPSEQVDEIVEAIRRHGWTRSLVVTRWRRRTTILAGHAAATAAREVGLDRVTATVLRIDPSSPEALAVLVGDNETAWLAETDAAQLAKLGRILAEHDALPGTGLDTDRLDSLELGDPELSPTIDAEPAPPPEKPDSVPGGTYPIGRHLLICGDCTDPETWNLGPARHDVLFTSPPYGIGQTTTVALRKSPAMRFYDDPDGDPWGAMMHAMTAIAQDRTTAQAVNVQLTAGNKRHLARWIAANADRLIDIGVWAKPSALPPGYAPGVLTPLHELIVLLGDDGASRAIPFAAFHQGTEPNTLHIPPEPRPENVEHGAVMPTALARRVLGTWLGKADTVIDPFGGTGTTALVAESLGMTCTLIERDPGYCDVIRDRWERANAA